MVTASDQRRYGVVSGEIAGAIAAGRLKFGDRLRFILRRLLLGEPDPRLPVTLCQEHPDCVVLCDAASAEPADFGL